MGNNASKCFMAAKLSTSKGETPSPIHRARSPHAIVNDTLSTTLTFEYIGYQVAPGNRSVYYRWIFLF